jgi:hypothetical protein
VRLAVAQVGDACQAQGLLHPQGYLLAGKPQVFGAEGHVVLHGGAHHLVVGILQYHAHAAADLAEVARLRGIQSVHQHPSPPGKQESVHQAAEGGFPGTVEPRERHELPFLHPQVEVGEGWAILPPGKPHGNPFQEDGRFAFPPGPSFPFIGDWFRLEGGRKRGRPPLQVNPLGVPTAAGAARRNRGE